MLLWGGSLLVTGAVFSFMAGIIHPYYTVALAPAIGALTGIGAVTAWRLRASWPGRAMLAAGTASTAIWGYELLGRTPSWHPLLRVVVLAAGLAAAAAFAAVAVAGGARQDRPRPGRAGGGAGPGRAVGHLRRAGRVHAGHRHDRAYRGDPVGRAGADGGLAARRPRRRAGRGGRRRPRRRRRWDAAGPRHRAAGQRPAEASRRAAAPGLATAGRRRGRPAGLAAAGGPGGGLGGDTQVSARLASLLERDASRYRWAAATVGTQSAAPLQLATRQPMLAIGGFNGSDPAPTLAQFRKLVAAGQIHYFVGANSSSFGGGTGSAAQITSWVAAHFTAQTVGGVRVYDLTR